MTKLKTNNEYLKELLYKDIPWFPMEKYKGANIKIRHQCINDHIVSKAPSAILRGHGCAECNGNKRKTTHQYMSELTTTNFICLEEYITNNTKILHKCKICEHIWKAKPVVLLKNKGCPKCAKKGFNIYKPTRLYFIKVSYENLEYYKIGITNRTIKERYSLDTDKKIEPIIDKLFATGHRPQKIEKYLLNRYKFLRVTIKHFLKSGGNTELFEINIIKKMLGL